MSLLELLQAGRNLSIILLAMVVGAALTVRYLDRRGPR